MGQPLTWEAIAGAIGFFILVSGTLWAVWWRIESRVERAKHENAEKASLAAVRADLVAMQLADYKVHVAENFVTKRGHREANEQIMVAIGEMRGDVRGIRDRLDAFIDHKGRN